LSKKWQVQLFQIQYIHRHMRDLNADLGQQTIKILVFFILSLVPFLVF